LVPPLCAFFRVLLPPCPTLFFFGARTFRAYPPFPGPTLSFLSFLRPSQKVKASSHCPTTPLFPSVALALPTGHDFSRLLAGALRLNQVPLPGRRAKSIDFCFCPPLYYSFCNRFRLGLPFPFPLAGTLPVATPFPPGEAFVHTRRPGPHPRWRMPSLLSF